MDRRVTSALLVLLALATAGCALEAPAPSPPAVTAAATTTASTVATEGVISQSVSVPSVLSKLQSRAIAAIASAGLKARLESKHDSAKKGTVLAQRPTGSSRVPPGSTVLLTISSGPDLVTVPNFVKLVIKARLSGSGYSTVKPDVERFARRYDLKIRWAEDPGMGGAGDTQSPRAGSRVPRGTTVKVVLFTGE